MRFQTLLFLVTFATSLAHAQPPEEVSSDTEAEDAESMDAEPVAEPRNVPAPQKLEDKTVKGVSLSPAIGLYPFGYDSINIGGAEGGRYFLFVRPSLGFNSSFKTSTEKQVDFNFSYAMEWREYYNKEATSRDFLNAIDGTVSVPWTDRISTDFGGYFEYFFKTGADTNADDYLLIEATPTAWFKVNDQLKFKLGYHLEFSQVFNWEIDPSDANQDTSPPTDVDDFRRGSFVTDASVYDNYDPSPAGLFPGSGYISTASTKQDVWIAWHGARTGLVYQAMEDTKLSLDYELIFFSRSNFDAAEYELGHYIVPKISQGLPWKGGTVSLAYQLRFREYKYAVTDDGSYKQDMRNRITLSLSQPINQYMTFDAYYRFHLVGSNKDSFGKFEDYHWFYTGLSFGF